MSPEPYVLSPLKLAIISGGSSSFYITSHLLLISSENDSMMRSGPHYCNNNLYDSLWAPHSLVHYRVTPDYPEAKVSLQISIYLALHPSAAYTILLELYSQV